MSIEKSENKVSKYVKVKNYILDRIKSGEFAPDTQVPSENEIANTFEVSIVTARKALSDLVHEGFIYRIRGKGSFVRSANPSKKQQSELKIVTFVILSDQASDSSLMRIILGAQSYLSSKGYSMIVECSNNDIQTEKAILEKCIDDGVAGVLIFSVDPEANADCYESLQENDIPFVMVDRSTNRMPVNHVSSYNLDGAYRLTEYLISLGHDRIVFAASNPGLETERMRHEGYRMALLNAGIDIDPDLYILNVLNNLDQIYSLVKSKKATAIMCVNDACAGAVINHLKKYGIRIPEEVSVTGFDGTDFGSIMTPSLTTVKQYFSEMGRTAAEMLLSTIENKGTGYGRILLPTELIIRDSTGPAV